MTTELQFECKYGDANTAVLDIIFIHGISGNLDETWTNSAGEFWPSWLAHDFPDVRIFTAGYPSSIFEKWAEKEMNLHERASNLAEHMASCGIGKRPLVIVCHSLGGLLAKEVFRACCETQDEEWAALGNNLKLVAFYATPHDGAALARVIKFCFPRLSSPHIAAISNDSGYLSNLNERYRDHANKKGVISIAYYERFKTWKIGLMVSRSSADPGCCETRPIPVDANHIQICKPNSKKQITFLSLRRHVVKILEKESRNRELSFEADILNASAQGGRQGKFQLADKTGNRDIFKTAEDVEKLEETLKDFSKLRRVTREVSMLSKRAAAELDARNIPRAKISIAMASDTQVEQNLMKELATYSSLKLMWGRAELLDGEIESASRTFLSIGAMLRHFDPVEAALYLKDAGRTCFNHGQSYGGPALLHSVQMYKRAIQYIRKNDNAQEWSKIKNYLGESYRLLGRRNVDSKYYFWLNSALQQYRSSLAALGSDSDAYESAMINANIALAYGYKGRFEDQRAGLFNLKISCELFEDTLAELPLAEHDLLAAKISHYLGNGYGEIGIRSSGAEKTQYLETSISKYEAALKNAEFCKSSYRRANTLNNLSNAIIQLCAGPPNSTTSEKILDAKQYCENALTVRDKVRFPLEFAQTSTNLAHVYLIISRLSPEGSLPNLRVAQRKCNEANQIRTPDEVPLDWAETRLLQGEISEEIGKVAGDRKNELCEDPIEIYSDVLSVVKGTKTPYYQELAERRLKVAHSQFNG